MGTRHLKLRPFKFPLFKRDNSNSDNSSYDDLNSENSNSDNSNYDDLNSNN